MNMNEPEYVKPYSIEKAVLEEVVTSRGNKSLEEYEATAMLLGMNYDPRINTFYITEEIEGNFDAIERDADTFDKLSAEAIDKRWEAWRAEHGERS